MKKDKKENKRPGVPTGNRYAPEEWLKIRFDYESGKYKSVGEMVRDYKSRGERIPSPDALRRKSAKEKWNKHKYEPAIKMAMTEKYISIFEKVGVGDEFIVNKIKEMIDTPSLVYNGLKCYMDFTGRKAPTKIANTDPTGEHEMEQTVIILPENEFKRPR